jgi:hypothetical protein
VVIIIFGIFNCVGVGFSCAVSAGEANIDFCFFFRLRRTSLLERSRSRICLCKLRCLKTD